AAPFFVDFSTSGGISTLDSFSSVGFWHPFSHELLGKLMTGNLDSLFSHYSYKYSNGSFRNRDDSYGGNRELITEKPQYHELKRPYSLYNWEAGFHAPMLLVDRLLKSQQFDQALKMCHYVFNPLEKGAGATRFWQFPPFKEVDAEDVLETLFAGLQ